MVSGHFQMYYIVCGVVVSFSLNHSPWRKGRKSSSNSQKGYKTCKVPLHRWQQWHVHLIPALRGLSLRPAWSIDQVPEKTCLKQGKMKQNKTTKHNSQTSFPVVLPAGWTDHSRDVVSHRACWAGPFTDVAVRMTCTPVSSLTLCLSLLSCCCNKIFWPKQLTGQCIYFCFYRLKA